MFIWIKRIIFVVVLVGLMMLLNFLVGTGVSELDIDTENLDFERILFVPGINTSPLTLSRWKKDLEYNFSDREIIFLDSNKYFYWQDEKTEKIVEEGVGILNDSRATLLIAHSYGGVLAKTMIERADNANIIKLITMASPHEMDSFGIDESKQFLQTPKKVDVPTFSFGGFVDPVVLFFNSDVENSQHQDIWTSHWGFLFNKNIRKQVLESAL